MIVDVDELGVDIIRDLRVVFPSLKIVAVSTSPARLTAAKRAGANATVRRAAAKQRLTKVVKRLLQSAG
jgi:Zn-dependent alcohol dehydrogenase